jgi:hypothetical protein
MFEQVREYEPEFKDSVEYCINYKSNITYVSIKKAEPELMEAYVIMTRTFLYCFQIKEDEYPLVFKEAIKTDDIAVIQLSLVNKYAGVFKLRNHGAGVD